MLENLYKKSAWGCEAPGVVEGWVSVRQSALVAQTSVSALVWLGANWASALGADGLGARVAVWVHHTRRAGWARRDGQGGLLAIHDEPLATTTICLRNERWLFGHIYSFAKQNST